MNQLGLGFMFSAKDLASSVMDRVGHNFLALEGTTSEAGKKIKGHMADAAVGFSLFGAGAMSLYALSKPLESAKAFGAAIAEVSTEVDGATFSTKAMHDVSLDLSRTFGKLPVEEAKGLYQAVAAGASDASKATALMTTANELAIGGVTDTTTAIDGLTSALNAYHLAFTDKNIKGVSDAFFVAMADGKTKVGELAQQIGRVAPSAQSLGITFDELLASISSMTGVGLRAEMAVAGMHGALANIIKPSSDAAAEAQRLGIKFSQTELRAKGWKGFLDEITHSARFNASSLSKLFGSVEGLNAITALTANNSEKFNAILGDMANKSGRTQNAFDKMADTLEFQENKFGALEEVAKTLVGEALEPAAKAVLRLGSSIVDAFTRIPAPVREFLTKAFAIAAVLLTVVGGALATKAAFGLFSAGMSAAGVSVGGFLATLAPVALVIGGITLAFLAFKEAADSNLRGMGSFASAAVANVSLAFRALGQLFEQGGFSGDVLAELDAGNQGVERFAINVFVWVNRIREYFSGVAEGFKAGIAKAGPTFDAFITSLENLGRKLGFVSDAVDPLANGGAFDAAGRSGKSMGDKLALVATMLVKVATAAVDLSGMLVDLVDKLGGVDTIVTVLKDALIVLAAYGIARTVTSMAGLGATAIEAAFSIGKLVAGMVAGNAAGAASGLVAAMSTITTAAAAALGPIGALTAAIAALYLAYDQWGQLQKNLGEHGWSDMWKKFKNDVGVTSDEEYGRELGIVSGPDYQRQQSQRAAERKYGADAFKGYDGSAASLNAATEKYGAFPAAAQPAFPAGVAAQSQADASGHGAAATAALVDATRDLKATKAGHVALTGTVIMDSAAVGTIVADGQRGEAARAGVPVAVIPQ